MTGKLSPNHAGQKVDKHKQYWFGVPRSMCEKERSPDSIESTEEEKSKKTI